MYEYVLLSKKRALKNANGQRVYGLWGRAARGPSCIPSTLGSLFCTACTFNVEIHYRAGKERKINFHFTGML